MGIFDKIRGFVAKTLEIRRPEAGAFGEFVAGNDTEEMLVGVVQGDVAMNAFLDKLIASKVCLLFNGNPAEAGRQPGIAPLALTGPDGQREVAMFTSSERATPFADLAPEYQHGLWVECAWALKGVQPGIGVILNPGWNASIEMPADGVQRFKDAHCL